MSPIRNRRTAVCLLSLAGTLLSNPYPKSDRQFALLATYNQEKEMLYRPVLEAFDMKSLERTFITAEKSAGYSNSL